MILIIADEANGQVGAELYQGLSALGNPVEYISLEGVEVKPCLNCGGCNNHPGRCATRDDGDWIYPKAKEATAIILVTPIIFGGSSFKMKRVLDKLSLIMDQHYVVRDQELVKGGMAGKDLKFFTVGIKNGCDDQEVAVFERLHWETRTIAQLTGRTFCISTPLALETKKHIIQEVSSP